jgi:hypothetical protein
VPTDDAVQPPEIARGSPETERNERKTCLFEGKSCATLHQAETQVLGFLRIFLLIGGEVVTLEKPAQVVSGEARFVGRARDIALVTLEQALQIALFEFVKH